MGYKPNRSPIFKAVQIFTTCVRDLLAMNRSILKALGVASVGLGAWYWLGLTRWQSLAASAAVYLITGGWRFTKVVILTLPRDAGALVGLIKIRFRMKMLQKSNKTMIDIFDDTVAKHPHKIALIMANGKEWTFAEVQRYSYQIANWIRHEGYQPGDCVALFMMGCPEYVCWWLGMARVSVIPALINFNLRNESLVHCINVAEAKAVIYGTELAAAIQDIQGSISGLALYNVGPNIPSPGYNIEDSVAQMSLEAIPSSLKPNNHDRLFYIFTSGTTGLPKAAIIKHYRFYYMVYGSGLMFGITPSDRIYDTLPLYHSAGGVLGIGQMIVRGCTIIVRPKFSASQYWTDCIKYQATAGQYIGEICRYLLAQPPRPTDAQHQVKRIYGNGIRPQIWKEFQQRFNVPNIVEFYGATEGNSNVVNYLGKVGAIGFTTRILPFLYPVSLIRVDTETGEPLRDRNGLCVHCNPGEAGELVGKISNTQIRRFDGYVGSQDKTKKKITHNVFKHGDQAFLTGDILEMDEYGYFYFKDRSGDTFRWKGENVSTLEVEGILHNVVEYRDAVVFGVEIPGNEGRAGMAAIANDHGLDLQHVYHQLQLRLPAYARPVIIRLLDEVDKTATFKLKKKKYVEEGFNPFEVKDSLYYLDARQGMYVPIDGNVYEQICTGKIRL